MRRVRRLKTFRLHVVSAATMFAGKTTKLREAYKTRCVQLGKMALGRAAKDASSVDLLAAGARRCCFVTHAGVRDHEDATRTSTHALDTVDDVLRVERLADVAVPPDCAAVFVDEAQFYPDLHAFVDAQVRLRDVWVAGLTANWQGDLWGQMAELERVGVYERTTVYAHCDECVKARAVKNWPRDGAVTEAVRVGGARMWQALCRSCWLAKQPV